MPPHIIRNRLSKALRATKSGYYQRLRVGQSKRRGTHQNGVIAYPETVHFRTTSEQFERIERICRLLLTERAIIMRDALDIYLSIAETEFSENNELPDLEPIERKPRKRKLPLD